MIKNIITKIHLWLGLASGIVVLIVSVTGCLFAFSEEITGFLRKVSIYNDGPGTEAIPVSRLYSGMQQVMGPEKHINWVNIYTDPAMNYVFYAYRSNDEALTYFGMVDYYDSVYANPYTGTHEGMYDEKSGFFGIVKFLHWSLLLSTRIGQPIVGWSTFIFVILLISGMVLWWPCSKKGAKNSFFFRWPRLANSYRKLYDLHNVPGFYTLLPALVIALTGLIWSFSWFEKAVYFVASGGEALHEHIHPQSLPHATAEKTTEPVDLIVSQSREKYPDAYAFRLYLPDDSVSAFSVYVQQHEGRYNVGHELHFDRHTGKLLQVEDHSERNSGEKLLHAGYDIHVGAIWGLPGKILAFIASLISASLPVTGFLMWLSRTRKRRKSL